MLLDFLFHQQEVISCLPGALPRKPTVDLKTSVGLTIGYVPQLSSVAGVRAGVSVGGTVALGADSFKMSSWDRQLVGEQQGNSPQVQRCAFCQGMLGL